MLLDKGAEVNALNDRGQSPVAGAVFKGWEEVVRVLAGTGADVNAGRPSAVEAAGMFRRWECAKILGIEDEVKKMLDEKGLDPVGGPVPVPGAGEGGGENGEQNAANGQ